MSYTPPNNQMVNLEPIIALLQSNNECCNLNTSLSKEILDKIMLSLKCCEFNTKYLLSIDNRLNRYESLLIELLKKCDKKPLQVINIEPGQIVHPPRELPRVEVEPAPVKVKPIRDVVYESYEGAYFPDASIIDISSKFSIVDDKYIDKSGMDLKGWLPYEVNLKKDSIILEKILDYRIITGGGLYPRREVILVYQVRDINTNVVKTYEAGVGHFRSWWKIYR
jgi:hypothetical protein